MTRGWLIGGAVALLGLAAAAPAIQGALTTPRDEPIKAE
jgi:hypothetical protein